MSASEKIEEVQSKKSRKKGLEAWAEMLEQQKARALPPTSTPQPEQNVGGSSRVPRDSVFVSDPKNVEATRSRLEAMKAANLAKEAELRRTQDTVEQGPKAAPAKEPAAAKKPETGPPKEAQAPHPPSTVVKAHSVKAATEVGFVVPEPAPMEATPAAHFLEGNSKTASEERLHLNSLAGLEPPTTDKTTEETIEAAQDALKLAALRSGVGANPELAAKEYVLASDIPGVKDTLQGGIYEEFRVAL